MFHTTSSTATSYEKFTAEAGSAAPGAVVPSTSPPIERAPARPNAARAATGLLRPRVKRRELFALTSQLAIMARTGVDMAGALQTLARQARRPALRMMLERIHRDIVGGKSLSDSLRPYERVFGNTYIATIAAGEASGRLGEILSELARLLRSEIRLRNSLYSILAYPVLLTAVSSLVLVGLVLFVLPRFAQVFNQFDMPLPVITRIVLEVSSELSGRLWLWGSIAATLVLGLFLSRSSETGKSLSDRILLKTFPLRNVTQSLLIGRTCRLLGITLSAGVPLLDGLRLARDAVQNSLYRRLLATLDRDVTHGHGLGETLLAADFVPAAAAEMIATAERTGTLASVIQLVGEHYEEEGEARLRELVTILEPVIIVVMGVFVAAIVLSVMLPMFDISTLSGYR